MKSKISLQWKTFLRIWTYHDSQRRLFISLSIFFDNAVMESLQNSFNYLWLTLYNVFIFIFWKIDWSDAFRCADFQPCSIGQTSVCGDSATPRYLVVDSDAYDSCSWNTESIRSSPRTLRWNNGELATGRGRRGAVVDGHKDMLVAHRKHKLDVVYLCSNTLSFMSNCRLERIRKMSLLYFKTICSV